MKNLWNKLPAWAKTTLKAALVAALSSLLTWLNTGCTAQHIVRQSSTTTTTKNDGTQESISTTIEYEQKAVGSK